MQQQTAVDLTHASQKAAPPEQQDLLMTPGKPQRVLTHQV